MSRVRAEAALTRARATTSMARVERAIAGGGHRYILAGSEWSSVCACVLYVVRAAAGAEGAAVRSTVLWVNWGGGGALGPWAHGRGRVGALQAQAPEHTRQQGQPT